MLVSASGSTDTPGSGVSGYQHETSADGGATWSAATAGASVSVSAEGTTLVRFQALDVAGHASAWAQTSVQLDRTAPSAPTVAGGSLTWANAASRTVTASASTDAGSGLAGYQHRTSTDGGATWSAPVAGSSLNVPAEGETLVEYQSIDNVGNVSAWTPVPTVIGGTVRLDRTAPTTPTATGGSSGWLNATSLPIAAAGATDTGGSGVASYQYRTSTNGGTNWSAATAGATVNVTAQGTTLVEFRAIDGVGLMSPWSAISAGGTANLDQTAPTVPTITGGSNSYQNVASVTLTAAGSTDTGGSGLEGYQFQLRVRPLERLVGADRRLPGDGRGRGPHHRPVPLGRQRRQHLGVGAVRGLPRQHRQDRPHRPRPAHRRRRIARVERGSIGDRHREQGRATA